MGNESHFWPAVGAIAGTAGVILTLYRGFFHKKLFPPRLTHSFHLCEPWCLPISQPAGSGGVSELVHYLRICIKNGGHRVAEDVEVYLARVRVKDDSAPAAWMDLPGFRPGRLTWEQSSEGILPHLASKMRRFCDFATLRQQSFPPSPGEVPRPYLQFSTEIPEKSRVKPGTTFRAEIRISSRNTHMPYLEPEIFLNDRWPVSAEEMERTLSVTGFGGADLEKARKT